MSKNGKTWGSPPPGGPGRPRRAPSWGDKQQGGGDYYGPQGGGGGVVRNNNNNNNTDHRNPFAGGGIGRPIPKKLKREANSNNRGYKVLPNNEFKRSFVQESPFVGHAPQPVKKQEDDEIEIRKQLLEDLMKKSLTERCAHFEKILTEEERLGLFMPTAFGNSVSVHVLPMQTNKPWNWTERQKKAIADCKTWVVEQNLAGDAEDSDSSGYSSDGYYGKQNQRGGEKPFFDFLNGLKYCYPLEVGFHAPFLQADDHSDAFCYCPCGTNLKSWREFCSVEDFLNSKNPTFGDDYLCGYVGKKKPFQLLRHISSKVTSCLVHALLWEYLSRLFRNYHDPGMRHLAFEDFGTTAYKRAVDFERKKIIRVMNELKKEAENARKIEGEKQKLLKEKQELLEVNRDLSNELDARKALREKLKIEDDAAEKVGIEPVEVYKSNYIEFCEMTRKHFPRNTRSGNKNNDRPILEVPQGHHLSQVFQKWYDQWESSGQTVDGRYGFLFAEFSGGKRPAIDIQACAKVMQDWDIHYVNILDDDDDFSVKRTTRINNQKTAEFLKQEFQAIDHGGATRNFFEQVFTEMSGLYIGVGGDATQNVLIFEASRGGVVPHKDEWFDEKLRKKSPRNGEEIRFQIACYFRAIGRMIAHCLLVDPGTFGPIVISAHCLPKFYTCVFLQHRYPLKQNYKLGEVVDHACELLEIDVQTKENPYDVLVQKVGLEDIENEGLEKENAVREKVNEIFLQSRLLFMNSFADGLSLTNLVNWKVCFGLMPSRTARNLVFREHSISEGDIFDENGEFRFITFEGEKDMDIETESMAEIFKENQRLLKEKIADLFRSKVEYDPSYMNKLVALCTGQSYLPDLDLYPEWRIKFEFNNKEHGMDTGKNDILPIVWTCDKVMILPVHAYDGNIETFEERLDYVLEHYAGGIFDST